MHHSTLKPATRNLITLFSLAAAFMTQLDTTIANVALPHMQASTSASREQITWVLTSYIIMAAIFTPLSGWLATRFGRKRVMVFSVLGFTVASMLCGMAANFGQLIAFRLLQGIMGAALLPMSQAILLDINPPEKHGSAMAVWGMGAVMGPILGPVLGGYLTEFMSWRWTFYINLPIGIASAVGLMLSVPPDESQETSKLDLVGFGFLALAVGSFQLLLDRGQSADWFESWEIRIEALVCVTALYLFVVHTLTTRNPFVKPALFADRNFLLGNVFGFLLGGLMYGVMALTPPLLTELMGYPIKLVGIVSAPRGIGTMVAMLVVGRIAHKFDPRHVIVLGLAVSAVALWMMSGFSLEMDSRLLVVSGFIQGVGGGIMFVPITTVVFATMNPQLRNEGAALNSLIRNLAGAAWISVLQTVTIRNAATVQSRLVEGVRPDNPAMELRLPDFDLGSVQAVAGLDGEIMRQALMVSYIDSFWLMCVACIVVAPLVVFLRR